MKKVLLAILTIGMMVSCVEERNRYVIAHRVDGNDTTSLQIIRVDREYPFRFNTDYDSDMASGLISRPPGNTPSGSTRITTIIL